MQQIRNFSIIAHVDHGKSTLADRLIQICGGLAEREMQSQVLDNMALERERGITIKAQSVTLFFDSKDGQRYQLNLIDTPAMSISPTRCRAASPPVRERCWWWTRRRASKRRAWPTATPPWSRAWKWCRVLNKIDLPSADPDKVIKEIEEIIGIDAQDALRVSAKTGENVPELLEELVRRIPAPKGNPDGPLQALIIDSWFDNYVAWCRWCAWSMARCVWARR